MADFPLPQYKTSEIKRAGKRLAQVITEEEASQEDVAEVFRIANNWRDSHSLPLKSIRLSVQGIRKRVHAKGNVASRTKRMESIRRKLADPSVSVNLNQMDDLGGCRIILSTINGVRDFLDCIHSEFPHEIRKERDYINNPKLDGYRSHHIVFNFTPRNERHQAYSGLRIELQVRTRLQHAWATAVEAISLFRGEDLKHHEGDKDWLRLFELASAEFAHNEQCVITDNRSDRIKEIKELNRKLGAIDTLDHLKNATNFAVNYIHTPGRYYLISYHADHSVTVTPYNDAVIGAAGLGEAEKQSEILGSGINSVLVEVDKVDKLIELYPNYFGDVTLFVNSLRRICKGKSAVEYILPSQPTAPAQHKPVEQPDFSWLYRHYRKGSFDASLRSTQKKK